jgi:hypothetical protein
VIPFIAAESLLAFAVFGWGSLADRFRALIQHYGGPYMLSVAQGFFALMVGTCRPLGYYHTADLMCSTSSLNRHTSYIS